MRPVRLLCALTLAACSGVPELDVASRLRYLRRAAGSRRLSVDLSLSGNAVRVGACGARRLQRNALRHDDRGGTKTLGTVFVRSGGSTRTLYSFQGGADGAQPEGSLVAIDGVLYGTTEDGGSAGDGTVFSITPSGDEHVVYSFKGGTDGALPVLAGLAAFGGNCTAPRVRAATAAAAAKAPWAAARSSWSRRRATNGCFIALPANPTARTPPERRSYRAAPSMGRRVTAAATITARSSSFQARASGSCIASKAIPTARSRTPVSRLQAETSSARPRPAAHSPTQERSSS